MARAVPERQEIEANGVRLTLVSRPGLRGRYTISTREGSRRRKAGPTALAGVRLQFTRSLNQLPAGPTNRVETGRRAMQTKRYWLDYDPVALAVLVIGIGAIELLALSI